MTPLIAIERVTRDFIRGGALSRGVVRAVDEVSLTVERGQTLGIVGESGSGKSTLLLILLRLLRPTAGAIRIDGVDIATLRGAALKAFRRRIQPVFQNPAGSLNPRHTVGAILAAPLAVHGIGDRASRRNSAIAALARVGLAAEMAARYPHQLSGGQKQRVAIARAVILEPAILLADEPTASLDATAQLGVLDVLDQARHSLGLTTILVSHDLAVVRRISDHVAVMHRGRLIEHAPTEELFAAPRQDLTRALIAASNGR